MSSYLSERHSRSMNTLSSSGRDRPSRCAAAIGRAVNSSSIRQGEPVKDPNGRFIKGDLIGYAVMEKRTGWGTEYPDDVRNGEWEYQAFKADKSVNTAANLPACFNCHKPLDKQDFVFLYDKMKAAPT